MSLSLNLKTMSRMREIRNHIVCLCMHMDVSVNCPPSQTLNSKAETGFARFLPSPQWAFNGSYKNKNEQKDRARLRSVQD